MKRYIVVRYNALRQQKFYKWHKTLDSWTVFKEQAYKYISRRKAEAQAKAADARMSECLRGFVKHRVEEVDA